MGFTAGEWLRAFAYAVVIIAVAWWAYLLAWAVLS